MKQLDLFSEKVPHKRRGPTPKFLQMLLNNARSRARYRKVPFNLTVADIFVPEYCPVLGIKLRRSLGKQGPGSNSPTIDRIHPDKGYVKGNIMVISAKANRMKQDADIRELRKVVSFYEQLID